MTKEEFEIEKNKLIDLSTSLTDHLKARNYQYFLLVNSGKGVSIDCTMHTGVLLEGMKQFYKQQKIGFFAKLYILFG
jgi:hypothetical protein